MPGRYRQREDDFILDKRQYIELAVDLDRVDLVVLQFIFGQILPGANRQQSRLNLQLPIQPTEATLAKQHQPSAHGKIEPGPAFGIDTAGKLPADLTFTTGKLIEKPIKAGYRHLAFQHAASSGKLENVSDTAHTCTGYCLV